MLYLLLAIAGSAMIAVVMRLSQGRVKGSTCMLSVNYAICMLLSGLTMGFGNIMPQAEKASLTLVLGLINGFFFFVSLILNQIAIRTNGVVLSSIFSRLGGLLIPFALSVAAFGESPRLVQLVGAVIAVASIILMNYNKDSSTKVGSMSILIFLLLSEGAASSGSKVYNVLGDPDLTANFLFWTFAAALIVCTSVAFYRKERFGVNELLFGSLFGIPNFLGSRFTLMALQELPAVIVYPMRSVASILLITLFGVLLFKEKLRKTQWIAMAAILVSVALLNI